MRARSAARGRRRHRDWRDGHRDADDSEQYGHVHRLKNAGAQPTVTRPRRNEQPTCPGTAWVGDFVRRRAYRDPGVDLAALAHPWRRLAARRLRAAGPSRLDPLPEVVDGGVGLRAYLETRGHKLEIVEASRTSCTLRMTIGPLGSRPAPLTLTRQAVEAAGWSRHPVWLTDPQRFLEAAATRAAARKILADESLIADQTRPVLWTSGRRRRGLRRAA